MSTVKLLVSRIVDWIQHESVAVGQHLPAQLLAEKLKVSRSPINLALKELSALGILKHKKNCGYFLARQLTANEAQKLTEQQHAESDLLTHAYFQIADDLLTAKINQTVTETELRQRYQLSHQQVKSILYRIHSEGWVKRRPGYGWEFSSMMMTPEALLQSYRLRLALEPAALLEPGYQLDADVLERCRKAEHYLLDGGIETASADYLHERGVYFHESIVAASGNPFLINAIRRVNKVRRLLSYRTMRDRSRYRQHCLQHLEILDLLEKKENSKASGLLRQHLQLTLDNLGKIQLVP